MTDPDSQKQKSTFREYTEAIVIALVLALFIRTFIVQAFKIPSGSMLPTLKIGDHLLVNKFIYGVKVPFSGKVIIPFKSPRTNDIIVFKYPKDTKLDYIKRVVAIGGDTVESRNKTIFINGTPVNDKFVQYLDNNVFEGMSECKGRGPYDSKTCRDNFGPFTIPAGKVFVMGDNRDNSYDGRFWGYVDLQDIRGKALIIYWSWDVTRPLFSVDRLTSIRWNRIGDIIH